MSRRLTGIILMAAGAAALIGSLLIGLAIFWFSLSVLPGIEAIIGKETAGSVGTFLLLSWVWIAAIVISSAGAIVAGIRKYNYRGLNRRI